MSLDLTGGYAATPGADDHARGPSPGKVSRSERLPARRGPAPAPATTPVQADGGLAAIDDPFALHLGRGSSPALVVQCDGGVGAAGDAHEHHAEAVAAAVVRGESAEALLDVGAAGAPAVQRDEMTAAERRTALGDSDRAHGVELEQIAHRIAYQDELTPLDRTGLAGLGLDPARARFHPGRGDLQFWTFPRAATGTVHFAPVIAFRGTASGADVAEDATGSGIGLAQFTMNQALITHALHGLGGGVIATGHSLGGALAQIAGCYFPDQIASVVTFQAPGIASEVLDRIRNRDADHRPVAHHYRVDGCIVDDAGAEFIPGGVTVFGHDENPAHAHTTFPLLAERGDERGDWIGPTDPPEDPLAVAAMGPRVDPEVGATPHETSTAASPLDQSRTLSTLGTADAVRGGVGGRVLGDAARRDRYARLWIDEVVPAAQAVTQVPMDDFIVRRCREQEIADDVGAMLSNYRGLFPELAAADTAYRDLGSSDAPSEDAFVESVLARAGTTDDAGRERVRRYWANLPTGRGAATMGAGGHRDRSDITRDHAAGRAALERLTAPHTEHDPAERAPTPPPRERAPRRHDRHSMVAPDRGVISDAPAETIHAHAARGVSGSGGGLPHLAAIQRSFGHHDVTGVRAHVGGAAADAAQAIGAAAYATGDDVAFAGAPDLRQAAHEAAHVVQQRGGVRLDGGVGRAGDPYERHADDVAALVTRGESAEALLDTMAHRGVAGGPAVQRLVAEGHGAFTAIMYRLGMATPEQLAALRAQVETELSQGQPILPLSFVLGRERFEVQLDRADGGPLLEAIDGVAAGERRERRRAAAHEAELRVPDLTSIGATIADLIGIAGGEVGHGQELTVSLNVPLTPAISAAVRLRLGVEHQRDGFRAAAEVLGGLRLGTREAHGELLAGLRLEATGTTAERTAELLGAALGDAIRRATAGLIDGAEGAVTHHDADDIMTHAGDHEGVDAAVPLTVGGGLASPEHDEFGVELEGSAGTSLHTAAEGSADGAAPISFQAFDLDLRTTVGPFGLHLAASIPFRSGPLLPGEHMPAPSLEFEFSGELDLETARAALTAAVVDTALRLLLAAIATARGERVVDTGFAARVRAAASLGCSTIGAHLDGLAATSGDAAMSLTLGLKFQGEETEVSVRTARTADPVPEAARGVVDVEWGAATSVWRERL